MRPAVGGGEIALKTLMQIMEEHKSRGALACPRLSIDRQCEVFSGSRQPVTGRL